MGRPVCLITGVGDATGTALVKKFSEGGYQVAMIARNAQRLARLEAEIPHTKGFVCDVSDFQKLTFVVEQIQQKMGEVEVLLHNAVSHSFNRFMDGELEDLERNFRVNTTSLLHLARLLSPNMVRRNHGAILVTGNTASLRGVPNYALFAPTKAAQRILCQSLARELGPQKVHVGYVTIDGAIKVNWINESGEATPEWLSPPEDWPWKEEDFFVAPEAIADEVFHMAHQHPTAWSFETVIRPFAEKW